MSVASRKRARAMWLLAGFGGAAAASPSVPLLLDTYSGAAAAYSLRRLNTAYTGPVVQVRRSGDSAEDTFSADEVGDGTLAAWVTAGGGTEDGFVKTWYDQSGNGNDASQATAASQPQIVASGAVITNGTASAIKFVNNYLTASLAISQPTTIFFAARRDAINGQVLLDGITSRNIIVWSGGQIYQINAGAALSGGAVSSSVNHIIYALFNSTNSTIGLSTGSDFSGNAGTNGLNGLVIGASQSFSSGFNGLVCEVLIYDSVQSSNRTGIESNIATHYGITLS